MGPGPLSQGVHHQGVGCVPLWWGMRHVGMAEQHDAVEHRGRGSSRARHCFGGGAAQDSGGEEGKAPPALLYTKRLQRLPVARLLYNCILLVGRSGAGCGAKGGGGMLDEVERTRAAVACGACGGAGNGGKWILCEYGVVCTDGTGREEAPALVWNLGCGMMEMERTW